MDLGSAFNDALVALLVLSAAAYVLGRLLRWARRRPRGAHVLGAVLTEVTQSPAVREAKRTKKSEEGKSGDPPSESNV